MEIQNYISQLLTVLTQSSILWVRCYGFRLSAMKRVITTDVDTMGVDGVTFFVHPTWALTREATSPEARKIMNLFTLLHEAAHVMNRHPERLKNCLPGNRELVHMAADYAVNLHLVQADSPYPMPDDGLINYDYTDNGKALNAERILDLLLQERNNAKQQTQQNQQAQQNQPDSDDADSSDNTTASADKRDADDDASEDGKSDIEAGETDAGAGTDNNDSEDTGEDSDSATLTPESCGELLPAPADMDVNEQASQTVAAVKLAKSAGGEVPDWLQELAHKATETETSWLERLHDKFADAVAHDDYSYQHFNEPYAVIGMIEPTLYSEGIGKVAIVGDESGSMSSEEIQMITEQTKSLIDEWNPQETLIVRHTTEIVYTERLFQGQQPTVRKRRSSGGTYFNPVIDMLEHEQCDVVIWVTDCMPCDIIKTVTAPVIWLGTDWNSRYAFERYIGYGEFIDVRK